MAELAVPPPTPTPVAAVRLHTVAAGETARMVAEQYGIQLATLLAANALADPDMLRVGQELRVPALDGVLHELAVGESLRLVAERYGVPLAGLVEANGLGASPDLVAAGTLLLVPGVTPAPPAPVVPATVAETEPDGGSQRAASAERPRPAPSLQPAPTPARPTIRTYVVREGDTLRGIAEAAGLDLLTLIAANDLSDPDRVVPGRELRLLPVRGVEHVVRPGETLAGIAARYGVPPRELLAANGLADPDLLAVGTPLLVPGAVPAPPTPAPTATARATTPPAPTAVPPPRATPTSPPPTRAPAPAAAPAPPAPAPAAASGARVVTAKITGYAPGAGDSRGITASGTRTRWGTVAADTRLYPFGTRLTIEGFEGTVFVVEDTGSAVRGNIFDIWFPDVAAARRLGVQTRRVTILP